MSHVTVNVNGTTKTLNEGDTLNIAGAVVEVQEIDHGNWVVEDNYFGSKDFYLDRSDLFERALIRIAEMSRRKRADYAAAEDQFSNFRFTAKLFNLETEEAAIFQVAWKLSRISTLRTKGGEPHNESVEDTYLDLAVYAVIAYAIYRSRWED